MTDKYGMTYQLTSYQTTRTGHERNAFIYFIQGYFCMISQLELDIQL